jgi:transposase
VLDGVYVIGTNLPAEQVVLSYKGLSQVERAFRGLKTIDLDIRPIHHRRARRVRGHVLLCVLAYYVTWHMQQALAPMLFTDHDRQTAALLRTSSGFVCARSLSGVLYEGSVSLDPSTRRGTGRRT